MNINDKVFGRMGKVDVLIDGQFGSTGKGSMAAWMALNGPKYDVAASSASPNSGHTAIVKGRKYVTHHLPILGVIQKIPIFLTAASVINMEVLDAEVEVNGVDPSMVSIHPSATILTEHDKEQEKTLTRGIASTMQGVGSARARKILRLAMIAEDLSKSVKYKTKEPQFNGDTGDAKVFLEIPQGYSLSLNHGGFYPHATSRDCTVSQAIADINVHPRNLGGVIMTVRTYPIRVGNIEAEDGKIGGNSGGTYYDQKELSWEELGVIPERTTVTNRVRRVFSWSDEQLYQAISINRPNLLFVNFLNYLLPTNPASKVDEKTMFQDIERMCIETLGYVPTMIGGRGPDVEDVERWIIRQ